MSEPTTRLAPSPTGALHLGNARTFLVNWALARNEGWRIVMRVEDLDGPRIKAEAGAAAIDIMEWLGLDFDGEALWQSHDLAPYVAAMESLSRDGRVYACDLTRREIEQAATAPHQGEHELRFPRELRPAPSEVEGFDRRDRNYRLIAEDEPVEVVDRFSGRHVQRPAIEIGDFVVWTKRAVPAYQLAVVVDDLRQGVTEVVRGDDLLPSAGRQQVLYGALGHAPPRWCHLPLVLGPDGRRLAKRHGDTRLATYRGAGVRPERIVGLLGRWSGVCPDREEMAAEDFRRGFSLDKLDPHSVTFDEDDHAWLMDG